MTASQRPAQVDLRDRPARSRRKASPSRGGRTPAPRLRLEPLEDRLLLSLDLLGHWNGAAPQYSDGWVVGDLAFLGHFGNNGGIQIIDVSDPTNPTRTANFRSPSGWNDFRDVEVQWQFYNNDWHLVGYFSSDIGGGLVIADVTDPYNPFEIFRITSQHGGTNNVHTLSVEDGWLYEADSRTPVIRVFDVSDPTRPLWVRNINSTVGASVHEVTVQWGRLFTAGIFGGTTIEIFDVSQIGTPGNPVTYLGRVGSGQGLGSNSHTSWSTDDWSFIANAREAGGGDLSFWNISNPAAPQLAWKIFPQFPGEPNPCCVHQVMIRGNYLYSSWYTAGVRVYDISDPYNPIDVGTFDTYPGGGQVYAGSWGIFSSWYEYDSRVYAFDMQTGMYIFNLNPGRSPSPGDPQRSDGSTSRSVRGRASEGLDVSAFTPAQVAQLDDRVLTLTLGAGDDTVSVTRSADGQALDVVVNDTFRYRYATNQVRRLNVRALEGHDRIILDPSLDLVLLLDGGPGQDVVEGWSDAWINPPFNHQSSKHNARETPYLTLSVEEVLAARGAAAAAPAIDYSTHALLEHTGAAGLSGVGTSLGLRHGGDGLAASLIPVAGHKGGALLSGRTAGTGHGLEGMVKQVVWHKPWCT